MIFYVFVVREATLPRGLKPILGSVSLGWAVLFLQGRPFFLHTIQVNFSHKFSDSIIAEVSIFLGVIRYGIQIFEDKMFWGFRLVVLKDSLMVFVNLVFIFLSALVHRFLPTIPHVSAI